MVTTRPARAKLSPAQAAEIRARYAAPGVSQRDLAAEYGVSQPTINAIVRGRSFRTAPGPRLPAGPVPGDVADRAAALAEHLDTLAASGRSVADQLADLATQARAIAGAPATTPRSA